MQTKIVFFAFVAIYCLSNAAASVIREAEDIEALLDVSAPTRNRRMVAEEEEELLDVSAPTRQRRMIAEEEEEELLDVSAPTRGDRHKRLTCDLLSASVGGFQFNHSACAAHCLALRRKGGYCDNGTCICRK